jgi:hypothetical protein
MRLPEVNSFDADKDCTSSPMIRTDCAVVLETVDTEWKQQARCDLHRFG